MLLWQKLPFAIGGFRSGCSNKTSLLSIEFINLQRLPTALSLLFSPISNKLAYIVSEMLVLHHPKFRIFIRRYSESDGLTRQGSEHRRFVWRVSFLVRLE